MEPVLLPDPEQLASAATGLETAVAEADTAVTEILTVWSRLGAVYSAPEDQVVLQAFASLSTARDELLELATSAKTALQNYADEVASLRHRRDILVADIAAAQIATPAPGEPSPWPELQARVILFDSDVDAADADCARALSALHRYYTWSIADGLSVANSIPSGAAQGLAAELLSRYRDFWVPQSGAVLPDIPRLDQLVPDEVIGGTPYTRLPSGLLVPLGSNLPGPPSSIARPPGWGSHGVLVTNPGLSSPPAWARWGGRSLAVAGAGLAYWGTYTDRYNETLVEHPEWTDEQRTQSAVTHSAVVGTSSVVGGAGGAWAGAAAGAAIGSIFPGPGTLIGGVVGGIVGGIAGGSIGEAIGDWGIDLFGGD